MVYVDGNPSETVSGTVYDEYDGAFPISTVISPLEFTYKLPSAAITSPATTASSVSIYAKSPVLKMYYGHQYLFDLSHSSLVGGNLSFSKDNLYKLLKLAVDNIIVIQNELHSKNLKNLKKYTFEDLKIELKEFVTHYIFSNKTKIQLVVRISQ